MDSVKIMHRDIKLENILLKHKDDIKSVKLTDFGLATKVNVSKLLYPKCGTPGYVAPEIANYSLDSNQPP